MTRFSFRHPALLAAAAALACAAPALAKPAPVAVETLAIANLAPHVNFMTLLPGTRIPLRAQDAQGQPIAARWHVTGGELAHNDRVAVWKAPLRPGAYQLTATASDHGHALERHLSLIVTVPATGAKSGRLNGYPIGHYPKGFKVGASLLANRGSRQAYDVPLGFVELTKETVKVPVSAHYQLGDFAGKDGWVNGRKYLFVEPRLVEKLECLTEMLNAEGHPVEKIQLMSAFRSPYLNSKIGNHTTLSRHTYGDAADMVVPDFSGKGRADATDARILMAAVTTLDKTTDLVGGASLYRPTGGHGYFIHTDTRGKLVRW